MKPNLPSVMKSYTQEELDAIDVNTPLPLLLENSPLAKQNPRRAKLLALKLTDPIQVQNMNAVDIRAAIDAKIEEDLNACGTVSTETINIMLKFDNVLTNLHKNIYGTKNLNMNAEVSLGHSHVASMMRKFSDQGITPEITPVNITPAIVDVVDVVDGVAVVLEAAPTDVVVEKREGDE
jgi:hypothetical protein